MNSEVKVRVYFGSDFYLDWKLLDHLPSLLWLKNALRCLKSDYPFYARFSGFDSSHKTMGQMADKLNKVIELINSEGLYHIKERAPQEFDQEFSNIIHHHFELLLGSIEEFSIHYHQASPLIRGAIPVLNHLIHDMETAHREKIFQKKTFAAICCEIPEAPRFRMPKEFYQFFTRDIEFGDMVAHYGMVGKTWWEVFLDQDEEIFPEAIRPLNIVSGEFDLFFGEYKWDAVTTQKFSEFLIEHGQNPNNPELAIGSLPLGKLINDKNWSQEQFKNQLAQSGGVSKIEIWQNGVLSGSREFPLHDGFLSFERLKIESEMTFEVVVPYYVFELYGEVQEKISLNLIVPTSSQHYTFAFRIDSSSPRRCLLKLVGYDIEFEISNERNQQVQIDSKTGRATHLRFRKVL